MNETPVYEANQFELALAQHHHVAAILNDSRNGPLGSRMINGER